ncbi:uncharacterized protein LOC143275959 [Babylonia areolata]|uniref:uncharacterized protein LOC143275959 n=1 Tax=Babylonia areolata TaxID=304850 RepID=UPI003FD39410
MAEVDRAPRQAEGLSSEEGAPDPEGHTLPAEHSPQHTARDGPEGGGEDADPPPPERPSPEGLQDDPAEPVQPAASTAAAEVDGSPSQPTEGASAEEAGQSDSKPPSHVPDTAQKETTGSASDEERARGEGEREGGEGGEGGTVAGQEEGGDGGGGGGAGDDNQAPPTPTFSTDHEDQDDPDQDDTHRQQAEARLAAQAQAEAAELADQTPAMLTPSVGLPNKRLTNTPLEGAGLPLKPPTAQLPPVARGQVRGQQMTSAISEALKQGTQPSPKQLTRARRPPKYIRLATVTVSPARTRQLPQGPSLYYEEPRRPRKVITWDEATNARPPLRIDMEGPTPCSYTPRVKPLSETNAPAFTFGSKCQPEKTGGSRTAWTKSWFQTPHVWHNKVDFTRETLWPSPSHYPKGSSLGPRQRTMPEAPSFTFGHKMAYSIVKPGAPKEPSPNEYKRQMADGLVLKRGPSFTHQLRREGTVLWGASEKTPGPAAYSPSKSGVERPSFTIQGIRREKSHVLGPYSSL